mmetsp:Transcript_109812/g.224428  ORF Transcript_109812/g.224428 Transcript_109812/m.224428 type:complete len:134 (-) Transcript_109812:334-735(-)
MMKHLTLLVVAATIALASHAVSAFQARKKPGTTRIHTPAPSTTTTTTALNGIFDKIVQSMESGYAGGDESPYSKIKEQDRKRTLLEKKKSDERKKRGYTELKDVKKRTFAKLKYDDDDDEPPQEEKKKLFGLF